MTQRRIRAAFMRGGTSKALVFDARDLPGRQAWDAIFLSAMGSPDPNGRQLDGMGGGVSSVSKVCVVAPSRRDDADVDYTFGQVQITEPRVDYSGNCGNMSSAVGPFAVDQGMVEAPDGEATVRIFNTNTRKIIRATFAVEGGRAVTDGDLAIPGVAGTGAPVRLDFVDPGGASTGRLLPTGKVRELLEVPGLGALGVSMVDAANGCVFVPAPSLGLQGIEMPDEIERNAGLLAGIEALRRHASVAMGITRSLDEARTRTSVPFVGAVSPAQDAHTLSGEPLGAEDADLTARVIASGQLHRALPLTVSLCLAVAARIEGSVVAQCARGAARARLRLAMPSGVLTVGADVERREGSWHASSGSFYRTARRLFDGFVYC